MASSNANDNAHSGASQNDELLPLPAPPTGEETTKLDMSSGSAEVKMNHLGPLVVNKDGTLSRIENWAQMTENEQKSTLRIVGKRNKSRLQSLQAAKDGKEL